MKIIAHKSFSLLIASILSLGWTMSAQALTIIYPEPLCELEVGYELNEGIQMVREVCWRQDIFPVKREVYHAEENLEGELVVTKIDNYYGAVNTKGEIVIPLIYDAIETDPMQGMPDELIRVKLNGKFGYVNSHNEIVIPIEYDDFEGYKSRGAHNYDRTIVVTLKQTEDGLKKGLMYADGKPIADSLYDHISYINEFGLIEVKLNNKYGMINTQDQVVIPIIYDWLDFHHHKYDDVNELKVAMVIKDNKKGFVNEKGEIIVATEYDYVSWFAFDNKTKQWITSAKKDGKYGVINQKNELVIPFEYDKIGRFFYSKDSGYSSATAQKDGKFGLIDSENNVVVPFDYDYIVEGVRVVQDSPNLFIFRVINNNKFGMINEKGAWVAPAKYDKIDRFFAYSSGGYRHQVAEIKKQDKYGLVNVNGTIVIPIAYDKISDISYNGDMYSDNESHELYKVKINENYGIYNINGDLIIPVEYDQKIDLQHFPKSGYQNTAKEEPILSIAMVTKNGKYGAFNMQSDPIIPAKFDEIEGFERLGNADTWLTKVKSENKYGVYSNDGGLIVPVKYDEIGKITSNLGLIKVKSAGKYGFVNLNGEVVIPIQYDDVSDFEPYDEASLWLSVVKSNDKYAVINSSGNIVYPFDSHQIIPLHLNDEFIDIDINDDYDFITSEGRLVTLTEYDKISPVKEGLLATEKSGKWGYLNTKGEVAIAFEYDTARNFRPNGKARVEKGDESMLIDVDNKKVDWDESDFHYALYDGY